MYKRDREQLPLHLSCSASRGKKTVHACVERCRFVRDDINKGRRSYCKLVAGLLRDIGMVKCQLGEMAAGCQLLHESVGLYQWMPDGIDSLKLTVDDVVKIAEVMTLPATKQTARRVLLHANNLQGSGNYS